MSDLVQIHARRKCYLVGVLEGPAIDAVVGSVQVSFREPSNITVLEAARANGVEGAIPVKGLPGHLQCSINYRPQ